MVGALRDYVENKLATFLDGKSNYEEECGIVVLQSRGEMSTGYKVAVVG